MRLLLFLIGTPAALWLLWTAMNGILNLLRPWKPE